MLVMYNKFFEIFLNVPKTLFLASSNTCHGGKSCHHTNTHSQRSLPAQSASQAARSQQEATLAVLFSLPVESVLSQWQPQNSGFWALA